VILKAGEAIPLSEDHKPNRSDECQRIEQAGGNVRWAGTWRVGGVLVVSRAFGNRLLKCFVVAKPEIQEEIIKDDVEFLVAVANDRSRNCSRSLASEGSVDPQCWQDDTQL